MARRIADTTHQDHCGQVWITSHWTADDNHYGTYLTTRTTAIGWLWVVQYRKTPHEYYIVQGDSGECGEEPVVAGPFKTANDAMDAASMLNATHAAT